MLTEQWRSGFDQLHGVAHGAIFCQIALQRYCLATEVAIDLLCGKSKYFAEPEFSFIKAVIAGQASFKDYSKLIFLLGHVTLVGLGPAL